MWRVPLGRRWHAVKKREWAHMCKWTWQWLKQETLQYSGAGGPQLEEHPPPHGGVFHFRQNANWQSNIRKRYKRQ